MGKKTSRKNFRASGQCGRRGGELRNTHVRVGRILSRGGAKPLKQRTTIEINKNIRWVPPRGMCPLDRVFEILIGWIKEPRGPARQARGTLTFQGILVQPHGRGPVTPLRRFNYLSKATPYWAFIGLPRPSGDLKVRRIFFFFILFLIPIGSNPDSLRGVGVHGDNTWIIIY